MGKRKVPLFLMILVLFPLIAGAEDFSVTYKEGAVQLKGASGWIELAIGSPVSLDSSVRLAQNSLLQFKGADLVITLSRPGLYVVLEVVAAHRTVSSPGIFTALAATLRQLAFGLDAPQSTTMGARGADQSAQEEDQWIESSADVYVGSGKEYLRAGEYDKAVDQLTRAMKVATGKEQMQIHYLLATCASLRGDVREAWKQIDGLQPGDSDPWARDFILLKGRLLVDTCAYGEAASLLTMNEAVLAQDAQRASAFYFLLGLAYRGAGNTEKAKEAFSKVVAISKGSDLAKGAEQLLIQL
ncbi:MAG: tetratricopeptide repeat protein [Spirochaetia bacterium]|jgi:tetratricopeptide (TPR) repeat protein